MTLEQWSELIKVKSLTDPDQEVTLAGFVDQLARARGGDAERAWRQVLEAGASRVGQLYRYNLKRGAAGATFRPYAPLKLSPTERGRTKRAAAAEGVAPERDRCGVCGQPRAAHPDEYARGRGHAFV